MYFDPWGSPSAASAMNPSKLFLLSFIEFFLSFFFPSNQTTNYQLTQFPLKIKNKRKKERITQLAKTTSQRLRTPKQAKPTSEKKKEKVMERESSSENKNENNRLPLSEVVTDCVKRWFKDTLKEAKAGDINMQVLVGQMYYSGYGVPRDAQKGRIWISRASRTRSSVWKVSDKHPGYNASDSDSDEPKGDS